MQAVQHFPPNDGLIPRLEQLLWGSTQSKEIAHLIDALKAVEARLGTEDERPNDLELAQNLGHRLRNEACVFLLKRDRQALLNAI